MIGWILILLLGAAMGIIGARLHRHQSKHHYVWPDHTGKIHIPPEIRRHAGP